MRGGGDSKGSNKGVLSWSGAMGSTRTAWQLCHSGGMRGCQCITYPPKNFTTSPSTAITALHKPALHHHYHHHHHHHKYHHRYHHSTIAATTPPHRHQLRELFDGQFCSQHAEFLEQVSVVLGLHPDEATEPIVDFCLKHDVLIPPSNRPDYTLNNPNNPYIPMSLITLITLTEPK